LPATAIRNVAKEQDMKKIVALLVGASLLLVLAPSASAFTRSDRWKCRSDGQTVTRGWTQEFGDSPNDGANKAAFRVGLDEGEYLYCYSPRGRYSPLASVNTPVGDVTNLSYEIKDPIAGAGETYIAAILTSGDAVFLDPYYCQGTTSDPNWIRADFTGATGVDACSVWYNGVEYTSTATESAWDVFAAANPTLSVDYVFIGFWTFPGSGQRTYVADRIALGDRMYFGGGVRQIRDCTSGEIYC
jgi:hypothetical protein